MQGVCRRRRLIFTEGAIVMIRIIIVSTIVMQSPTEQSGGRKVRLFNIPTAAAVAGRTSIFVTGPG